MKKTLHAFNDRKKMDYHFRDKLRSPEIARNIHDARDYQITFKDGSIEKYAAIYDSHDARCKVSGMGYNEIHEHAEFSPEVKQLFKASIRFLV